MILLKKHACFQEAEELLGAEIWSAEMSEFEVSFITLIKAFHSTQLAHERCNARGGKVPPGGIL